MHHGLLLVVNVIHMAHHRLLLVDALPYYPFGHICIFYMQYAVLQWGPFVNAYFPDSVCAFVHSFACCVARSVARSSARLFACYSVCLFVCPCAPSSVSASFTTSTDSASS